MNSGVRRRVDDSHSHRLPRRAIGEPQLFARAVLAVGREEETSTVGDRVFYQRRRSTVAESAELGCCTRRRVVKPQLSTRVHCSRNDQSRVRRYHAVNAESTRLRVDVGDLCE